MTRWKWQSKPKCDRNEVGERTLAGHQASFTRTVARSLRRRYCTDERPFPSVTGRSAKRQRVPNVPAGERAEAIRGGIEKVAADASLPHSRADRLSAEVVENVTMIMAGAGYADDPAAYELNVYIRGPHGMARINADLHRHIFDVFNEYGVQIMTPAYEGDPDEPKAHMFHRAVGECANRPLEMERVQGKSAST